MDGWSGDTNVSRLFYSKEIVLPPLISCKLVYLLMPLVNSWRIYQCHCYHNCPSSQNCHGLRQNSCVGWRTGCCWVPTFLTLATDGPAKNIFLLVFHVGNVIRSINFALCSCPQEKDLRETRRKKLDMQIVFFEKCVGIVETGCYSSKCPKIN